MYMSPMLTDRQMLASTQGAENYAVSTLANRLSDRTFQLELIHSRILECRRALDRQMLEDPARLVVVFREHLARLDELTGTGR